MHDRLKIQLLGSFSVRLNDQPIRSFRSSKTRALLAYLATQPDQEHSRAALATLLWGDSAETAARTNLRIELSNLKKVLSDHPALEISRGAVRFHSAFATIDVPAFQKAVTGFLTLPVESQGTHLARLVAAIDLYQGEFLTGLHVDDAIGFEDWQLITREQLHGQMMQALETLQLRYTEQGHWPALANAARRQIAIVPWTESAHRNLIQALAAQGETQAALAQYAKCCEILQEELGVEPSLATQELAARLRSGRSAPPAVHHNLAQQLKSFVGRTEEIGRLHSLVQEKKLVTLLGIGGVGKSQLAQAVAQNTLHDFADGVWFVPLANVEAGDAAPGRIALAIAAAIGFYVTDMQAPLADLAAYLADRQMLLVLDNWDHLIAAAETVLYALLNSTPVHVLATSRTRLMIDGEVSVQLAGLPPAEAFTLFVDRARRVVPAFATDGDGAGIATDVYRICDQVAGLPLGIELAASWVEHYSVAEIGQSIAQIAIEPQQADGLVSRHHTLSSVFEYSWRLLSPRQGQILTWLSVFRGGFDRTAAAAVADCSLGDLSALIGHSLVQRVGAGRYDLHPLIQEFAAQKLPPQQEATLHGNHSHHYLSALCGVERTEWASRLLVDFENMRSAWQRAVRAADHRIIQQSATEFGEFIAQFGLMADGDRLFQDTVERFDGASEHRELVAQLLDRQWVFARTLRGMRAASNLPYRVLSLTNSPELQARAHTDLANRYAEEGAWERADFHFDRVEELLQASSDLHIYISAVESRVHINALHFRGDFAKGIARLEEMLALLDTATTAITDEENLRTQLLLSLSLVAVRYGDYGLAIRCGTKNLARTAGSKHRQKRVWLLLDLALAEQFAGMYGDAIAHNLEALALSDEIGAVDDIGLLSANLCLTMRQSGMLAEALAHGLKGAATLKLLAIPRQEGQARNRVGHTLLALERWADADAAYGEALAVWAPQQHPNRYEAVAGRAVAALHLGRREEALALVTEVLNFVAAEGLAGVVEPVLLLLNCEAVLSDLGQIDPAHRVLQQAEDWVRMIADRISDDAVRNTFLHTRLQPIYARLDQ